MRFRLVSIISDFQPEGLCISWMGPLPLRLCPFIFSAQNRPLLFLTPPAHPLESGSLPREPGSRSSRRTSFPLRARLAVRATDAHRPLPVRWGIAGGREGFPVFRALRTAPASLQTLQRRGVKAAAQIRALRNSAPPQLPTPPPPISTRPSGTFRGASTAGWVWRGCADGEGAGFWGPGELLGPLLADGSPACRDDALREPRAARAGLSAYGLACRATCAWGAAVEPEISMRLE